MYKHVCKDSFFSGVVIALIPIALAYYSFLFYNELMNGFSMMRIKLYPPRLQLIILAATLLLFRFMMIRWNMPRTGKGLFLTVFFVTIFYFFNHRYKIL